MQCQLNGVQINEAPKFLAENPNKTTHVVELVDPFDTTQSYLDVYSSSVAEYENYGIPKIYLTAEEPPDQKME